MCKRLRVLANNSVLLQTAQAFISRPDNQETGTQYDQVIKEQLEGGVAEEVQQDQVLEPGNVHYLLHWGAVDTEGSLQLAHAYRPVMRGDHW